MTLTSRQLARFGILVALSLTTITLVQVPHAAAVTTIQPINDTRLVTAGPVSVGFPIEHFGVVGELEPGRAPIVKHGTAPFGEVRFRLDGRWSAWRALEADGAQAPGQFTAALIAAPDADAYHVRGLPRWASSWRAAAINTTDGASIVTGQTRSDAAVAATSCRSRADWGADESISGWARGDSRTHYPAQALTVHHTAGSNSPTQDYAATVRAIYSYHVVSNGWSDIGYHYLVDSHGTVYEGRHAGQTSRSCLYEGGDGSDFAHRAGTDDVVTGAHVGNHNSGNVGIALMGCFEATASCSGDTTPPAAALDALEEELARLATRHALDPTGTVTYVNPVTGATREMPTISAHRDWVATECPGGRLYAQLGQIRTDVATRMGASPPATPTPDPAAITEAVCSAASCTFRGTGVAPLAWTFGNGRSGTGSPVSTTYTGAGTYTVTLSDGQQPSTHADRVVTCRKHKRELRCSS